MKTNYMKESIDILNELNLNLIWKEILIEIAKSNPSALVKARWKIAESPVDIEIKRMLKNKTPIIPCIKFLRENKNMGLKEAKKYIENLAAKNNLKIYRHGE